MHKFTFVYTYIALTRAKYGCVVLGNPKILSKQVRFLFVEDYIVLSSLELSDKPVYEPSIRVLPGTASAMKLSLR